MRVSNTKYPLRYISASLLILLLALFLSFHSVSYLDGIIVFFGLSVVSLYLICKKKKDYFDPMYLFSIYFIFVYISALVTYSRGLENNLFINSTYFYSDLDLIYTISLFVCFFSYISVLAGYYIFLDKRKISVPLKLRGLASPFFFLIAILFYFIGLGNFLYNIIIMYSGDFFAYFINISTRYIDFSNSGTTLGYNFLYAGSYMLFVRMLQLKNNVFFYILSYFYINSSFF
jgi:hypothetical protein